MTGTVVGLFRYPVKSFQGLAVDSLSVGARGVMGDRRFAVLDATTGHILSAKATAALLQATASESADGTTSLRLPDGTEVSTDDPTTDDVLSAWLGHRVRLGMSADPNEPVSEADPSLSYDMTFDPEDDDAELVAIPSPPGTFLDLAAVHVLTTASVEQCRVERPDTDWDVRRFR